MASTRTLDANWLDTLNPPQREAVTHGGGPLLVVAGAGSGKTWTLACRVAHLIDSGVPPHRILLLTFSRRAAREMLSRAERLIDGSGAPATRVWGGTFHAVANRLLRLYARQLGLAPDFTVLDQADGADLMNLIRSDLGLAARERRFPRKETLASIHSRVVNAGTPLGEVLKRHFPWCLEEADGIREVFRAYTARKRVHLVLDYDDLLVYWRALAEDAGAGPHMASRFDHVLVDEYQDTNALQADVLLAMHRTVPNVTVVGDDAQAIYGFRAATVQNILDFPQRFPGARVVRLEQNYRSTQPILDATNEVISHSPQRHEKTLWSDRRTGERPRLVRCRDEAEQCDEVCRRLLEHRERGVALNHQAVLFRTGHHSDLLEVELAHRNIPFVKYGGLKFMESAHVKDVLALLRILENPLDEVGWFRVLQLPEGMGPAAARRAMAAIGLGPEPGVVELTPAAAAGAGVGPLARFLDRPPAVPSAAGPEVDALRAAFVECVEGDPPAAVQVERLRRFLEPVFARRYDSAAARLRDLEQLEALASRFPERGRLLAELALDPPSSTSDLAGPPLLDEDYVVLSTIHSAKGGEWDVVHVIHAADGMIPSDMSTGNAEEIEEERRLFYVALTRARDALYVYFPLRFYRRPRGRAGEDAHTYAQLTRFLPPDVLEHFDSAGLDPSAPPDDERVDGNGTAAAGVDRFLAGLWES
ncbi:MAG TPA: ATP-dependent helicase [Actinomycetota bacterium]|nr:ATP-dependent helicase [Actinomycetota bacterium]